MFNLRVGSIVQSNGTFNLVNIVDPVVYFVELSMSHPAYTELVPFTVVKYTV